MGLLVEPAAPKAGGEASVSRALLTIDLTDAVLNEALVERCELVIAYHPPFFKGMKRFEQRDPAARRLVTLIQNDIALYSPHTALDAVPGGVNDWLIAAFGSGRTWPITQMCESPALKIVVFVPKADAERLRAALSDAGAGVIGEYSHCSFNLEGIGTFRGSDGSRPFVGRAGKLEEVAEVRIEMICPRASLPSISAAIAANHPYEEPAWDAYPLAPKPIPGAGMGRCVELTTPITLNEAVTRAKQHLGLARLRVAASSAHAAGATISRVAVCAGAGGSVLEGVADVDLVVSGELRHHDILARTAGGCSVIVCDHSNSERGYMPLFAERLRSAWGTRVEVLTSTLDADPLSVV